MERQLRNALEQDNRAEAEEIRDLLREREANRARLRPPPFLINCGARAWDEPEAKLGRESVRLPSLPDQEFNLRSGYGYSGGEPRQSWFSAIWGSPQPELYNSARVNPGSYRFLLPAGEYLVALGFCETMAHRTGERVFDVVIQDQLAAARLDPFAVAGHGQAFRITHPTRVRAGEGLTVQLRPISGKPPVLNVIWIYPPQAAAATPPRDFRGFGSYAMNVLLWDHPPEVAIAGYLIDRRAQGDAAFTPLNEKPVPVSRWLDDAVISGIAYDYRIRSVDVNGRSSDWSSIRSLTAKPSANSTLPVYTLELPQAALEFMLGDVTQDREAEGRLRLEGRTYTVRMRIRGTSTRHTAKKSYRIEFTEDSPPGLSPVIYLKAEPHDPTLQQEKLTCDVFAELGLPVSRAAFVNLLINGKYQGVYLDIEPIRSPFKRRAGLAPNGTLIRAATFQHLEDRSPGELRGSHGSLEELHEFIRQINRVDRGEFEAFVRGATDWDKVRDYLVASMNAHRSEIEADDYFYYRDPITSRWSFIPWDHNNGNFGIRGPGSGPERPFIPLHGQTLQSVGPARDYWHVLPSRIFQIPALENEYLNRLETLVRRLLLSGRLNELAQRNYQKLQPEAVLDPFRWPPNRLEPFIDSSNRLRTFFARHGERLLDLIESQRRRSPPAIVINEFQFAPDRSWVELHNQSDTRVPLSNYSLGSLQRPQKPWHRFDSTDSIEARGFRRVQFERERAPSPEGGTLALLHTGRRAPSDEALLEDEDRFKLVDWFFYGHQSPSYSYGRILDGFGFMTPTPGAPNEDEIFLPPPLLADGGVEWSGGMPTQVTALIASLCPAATPESVQVHFQTDGQWRQIPMNLDLANGTAPRATAALPPGLRAERLRYFFVAKARNDLQRFAPLTAPTDFYESALPTPASTRPDAEP